jgi:membrane protease YdiL (CAAX protease family)
MTPHERLLAVWDFTDLFMFITLAFMSLIPSLLLGKVFAGFMPFGKPFDALLAQLLWYVLMFLALYTLLKIRYRVPFWRSLGWRFPFRGATLALVAGPLLVFTLGLIGVLIRTPVLKPPFEQMLRNRPTVIVFALFVVVLGPLSEELVFRGFLLPLLTRPLGVANGIVITGLIFGALHAYEYEWSWRHSLLISLAGMAFGWARYVSGSTAASTLMHATFNLTQFVALIAQSGFPKS